MKTITDKNGVMHIMAKLGMAKNPISNMPTPNKEKGIIIFDDFSSMSAHTKQILSAINKKDVTENDFLSQSDIAYIKNYYNTPGTKDQILNVTSHPGCGAFHFLIRLGEQLNIKTTRISLDMADDNCDFNLMVESITTLNEKVILVVDAVSRAQSKVLTNFLNFLNTMEYNPNVKMVFTESINDYDKFTMRNYGEVVEGNEVYQLVNLV